MTLLLWTLGQLLGVALVIALVLVFRVALDALHLFHTAGLRRVRNDSHRSIR